MAVSLPTFQKVGNRFIQVADPHAATKAASVLEKHKPTITKLKEKLGFRKDETVVAWLLEQLELSSDLNQTISDLLRD